MLSAIADEIEKAVVGHIELGDLSDVSVENVLSGDIIIYDGDEFVNVPIDNYIGGITSASHGRLHNIDSILDHVGLSGVEDNFFAIDENGLFKDSGYNSSNFMSGS